MPGWFNNTKEVQVEVVVEQNKDDYYDVNFDKKTESPESMTFFFLSSNYLFKGGFISEHTTLTCLINGQGPKNGQDPINGQGYIKTNYHRDFNKHVGVING